MSGDPGPASFAAALLDPQARTPAGLRAWNGSDPGRRFDVHRNNVLASLTAALAASFPVVRELVGERFFQAMAAGFVRHSPLASPVLAEYGAEFPGFIAGFPPAAELRYLADMARLERLRLEAYHAADAPVLAADELAARLADPEALPGLRFEPHPACRLLRSDYAVFSLWAAHQADRTAIDLAGIDPAMPEDVLIVRPDIEVRTVLLPPGASGCFAALLEGRPLGEAALAGSVQDARFDLGGTLALMLREGLATRVLL